MDPSSGTYMEYGKMTNDTLFDILKSTIIIDDVGTYWYLNGRLHRVDGPAGESHNGTKVWYLNGKCHREDGPAIEHPNGSKSWYLNGKLHREDGPAIEHNGTRGEWYRHGERQYDK
jgi:antitoxin component YwqK of YwqJK toxin-antitoxin module